MQIEKRLKNHYKRWNIDFSYEEQFLNFKNRLITLLDKSMGEYIAVNSNVDKYFIEMLKLHKADEPHVKKSQIVARQTLNVIKNLPYYSDGFEHTPSGFGDTNIYVCVKGCNDSQELATVLQFLFWAIEKEYDETQEMVSNIVEGIRKLSILTPNVSFQIAKKGRQVIIYPYGDPFLDKGIIDCVLAGLEDYPKVAKHFETALRIYQSGETSQYRNLLDNLRFALEQLLKSILKSDKSLENQKNVILPWLNAKGLHKEVVNLYEKLLSTYLNYQNGAVKHNEAFSLDEVEFMIYLTGNFMRLILHLERQEKNVAK
ncbi:hypothetical protein [Nostoc sp. FACHB-110]|uniref:hypothetical protein n=1 Tax=Nostoc sp. FACHB-110 TaxID=2692834 RepID=UPI00168310B2|nr:hypothetical protein [Nostoc sp. FACHB-110]MBD2439102.1 hypothetical protein [Nostoc sp. FACHB-110]